jgi:hypothetical protein
MFFLGLPLTIIYSKNSLLAISFIASSLIEDKQMFVVIVGSWGISLKRSGEGHSYPSMFIFSASFLS